MSGRMKGRNPVHNRSIGRSVSWTLTRNWKAVKPCPQCGKRVYSNYAGNICKRCEALGRGIKLTIKSKEG